MRAWWLIVGLSALGACTDTDEGGCPFDLAGAVGESCGNDGLACGEASLCDPCTSDLSACEQIRCVEGVWVAEPPVETCPTG